MSAKINEVNAASFSGVSIQHDAYRRFFKKKISDNSSEFNLLKLLKQYGRIKLGDGSELKILDFEIKQARECPNQCYHQGLTYSDYLYLIVNFSGLSKEKIYIGTIPKPTSDSTFIIKGNRYSFIMQATVAPGVNIKKSKLRSTRLDNNKKIINDKCKIIFNIRPLHGDLISLKKSFEINIIYEDDKGIIKRLDKIEYSFKYGIKNKNEFQKYHNT